MGVPSADGRTRQTRPAESADWFPSNTDISRADRYYTGRSPANCWHGCGTGKSILWGIVLSTKGMAKIEL